jgi:hypothetical protein
MAILQTNLCCALLCLAIPQPTIRSDLYGETTSDSLLCSTLSRDTITDYLINQLSALICMAILQTTLCCTQPCLAILCTPDYLQCSMSGVTTTDYPLCSTCLYYNRLSALPIIHSTLSSYVLQPNIPCSLLCLLILQKTIQSTDCRYYNRLPALLCLAILQPTFRSAPLYLLILQATTQSTDYSLWSI